MPTVANFMSCPHCGLQIAIDGLRPHRCPRCGDICWPEPPDAPRAAVGLATAVLLAAPIWLALAGAIAWWCR